jgi:hypothetical protein
MRRIAAVEPEAGRELRTALSMRLSTVAWRAALAVGTQRLEQRAGRVGAVAGEARRGLRVGRKKKKQRFGSGLMPLPVALRAPKWRQ